MTKTNLFMQWSRGLVLLVTLSAGFSAGVAAAPVTYWFNGVINSANDYSNALPANITAGMPFVGRLSYQASGVNYSNVYTVDWGSRGNYYFSTTAGFSLVVYLGGHTLANADGLPGSNSGYVGVTDGITTADSLAVETSGGPVLFDGQPILNPSVSSSISLYLDDTTRTAIQGVALPDSVPDLSRFNRYRTFTWMAREDGGAFGTMFRVDGTITGISATEQAFLTVRAEAGNQVRLAWPLGLTGYTLQATSDLGSGNWQNVLVAVVDTGTEHTVTLARGGAPRFFRLKR